MFKTAILDTVAWRIADTASAATGHEFTVGDGGGSFGRSLYVRRKGHLSGHNVTVRVSDHPCRYDGQRYCYVNVDHRDGSYAESSVQKATAALVRYADEPVYT